MARVGRRDLGQPRARLRNLGRVQDDQPLTRRGVQAVDDLHLAVGAGARRRGFSRREGAAHPAREVDRQHRVVVRREELEAPPEIARRRLRGLRVMRATLDLVEELLRGDADLVEIAAFAEVHPRRHHVDVEPVHLVLGDVGGRIGDDRDTPVLRMRRALLAMHVVGLLARNLAKLPGDPEHLGRVVGVDVHPRLVREPRDDQAGAVRRTAPRAAGDGRRSLRSPRTRCTSGTRDPARVPAVSTLLASITPALPGSGSASLPLAM